MAYININESDKTALNVLSAVQRNTVFCPLNSSDGPSDKPVLCTSYSQFVQTFGTDPNTNSTQMTSWEYAANLLAQEFPVMVRRITHYLDDEGNNKVKTEGDDESGPLEGVELASAIVKSPNPDNIINKGTTILPPTLVCPTESNQTKKQLKWGTAKSMTAKFNFGNGGIPNNIEVKGAEDTDAFVQNPVGDKVDDRYTYSLSAFPVLRLEIKNNGEIESVIQQGKSTPIAKYLTTLSNPTASDINATVTNEVQSMTDLSDIKVLNAQGKDITRAEGVIDSNGNIHLASQQMILIDLSNSNVYRRSSILNGSLEVNLAVSNIDVDSTLLQVSVYGGAVKYPRYELNIAHFNTETEQSFSFVSSQVTAALKSSYEETVNNMTTIDSNGNINVAAVRYRYAGINGNRIKVDVHTVDGDAIYFEVYNGSQRLEQHKLVNLRYKNDNGYWTSYSLKDADDLEKIWSLFLENFGIKWNEAKASTANTVGDLVIKQDLALDYVTVTLNPALNLDQYTSIMRGITSLTRQTSTQLAGGSNPTDDCVINQVPKVYTRLQDKYLYNVKFLSNGGYVDSYVTPGEITKIPQVKRRNVEMAMITTAQTRGDCIAFLDIPLALEKDDALEYFSYIATSYATAYAPWVKMKLSTGGYKWCPPSFVALETIAKSVKLGNPVYAPPAGVNRAIVQNVQDVSFEIPADYIDYWSDNYTQFVNPIVYIDGYGYSIFGQKTLYNLQSQGDSSVGSALAYLNTRLVANEIKKKIFECCIELTFEKNNLHTWLQFNTVMSRLLEELKSADAITYYEVIMDESTMTDYDIRTNHIVGKIRVAVNTTAEKFDIDFELIPNSVKYMKIDYVQDSLTY